MGSWWMGRIWGIGPGGATEEQWQEAESVFGMSDSL